MSNKPTRQPLRDARRSYRPSLPAVLANGQFDLIESAAAPSANEALLKELFPNSFGKPHVSIGPGKGMASAAPLAVGVVLSGGPAPGGHNAIAGLYDALKAAHKDSKLFGFLNGPKGVFTGKFRELTGDIIDAYRNTGGFDMLGSGRDKIETPEQVDACARYLQEIGASALVVIGGDDSNTNAAILAENFLANKVPVQVIGLPKTIDGDMRNEFIETSFGFDTASKTYAAQVGNISRDAASARKYYHFIKLMGRSASHVALEVALLAQPNHTLISEEVKERNLTLADIVNEMADIVAKRAAAGRNYGVFLIPEGLLQFINEFEPFFNDLNSVIHAESGQFEALSDAAKIALVEEKLSGRSRDIFASFPPAVQEALIEKDAHGNLTVSQVPTEIFLMAVVTKRLEEMKAAGQYNGKFSPLAHFLGYEGRCAPPSNFDADYCYSLGYAAVQLVRGGYTGYTVSARNLAAAPGKWQLGGVPVASMLTIETRKGKPTPVIEKALVKTSGAPFKAFAAGRDSWKVDDAYLCPGPVQYFGPVKICGAVTRTLELETAGK